MNQQTLEDWLSELAARTPTPGGGAVAAIAAATSAGLIGMVTIYTTGPKWADREVRMSDLAAQAQTLRLQALALASEDANAYAGVGDAYKLPGESTEEKVAKAEAIQAALSGAAEPPVKIAQLTRRLVEICVELVEAGNPNVISDVAVAASMASSALESSIVNIEINRQAITDEEVKRTLSGAIHDAANAMSIANMVVEQVRGKIGKNI